MNLPKHTQEGLDPDTETDWKNLERLARQEAKAGYCGSCAVFQKALPSFLTEKIEAARRQRDDQWEYAVKQHVSQKERLAIWQTMSPAAPSEGEPQQGV